METIDVSSLLVHVVTLEVPEGKILARCFPEM